MAKTTEAKTAPSGAEQINTMQRLSQQAAAWLLELNGRTLRDHGDLPRSPDGSYNARELLAWGKARIPTPDLSDVEEEALLLVCEHFELEAGLAVRPICELLEGLRDRYGDAGLAEFAKRLLDYCQAELAASPNAHAEPTPAELEQRARQWAADERRRLAYGGLRVAVVCETCGRLRQGRRWTKGQPPAGFVIEQGVCPACEQR